MPVRVLVAYATKYDSTRGIAEFIAKGLQRYGAEVDVRKVGEASNLGDYDAFVIGSAIYMFHWLKDAREFVSENREVLSSRPVWLFSSGPLGTTTKNAAGRDLRDVSGPREIGTLREAVNPRSHHVFFGKLDINKLGLGYRVVFKMPAVREGLSEGDFRDWKEIEEWTSGIGQELRSLVPSMGSAP
ncbi:MAG: flavodoxin domain-containing protein [Nitrososphaerales archaeon]|jgi:menaquinone-dependent protoporphyrinogen oxidase